MIRRHFIRLFNRKPRGSLCYFRLILLLVSVFTYGADQATI
jgi:hypothetical protein